MRTLWLDVEEGQLVLDNLDDQNDYSNRIGESINHFVDEGLTLTYRIEKVKIKTVKSPTNDKQEKPMQYVYVKCLSPKIKDYYGFQFI